MRLYYGVALFFGLLLHALSASAYPGLSGSSVPLRLNQLRHTVYTTEQGAPSGAQIIRQAPDGLLWLVSSRGIASFDGVRFDWSLTPKLTKRASRALYIEPSGVIWVGHNFGGITRITDGHVETMDTTGLPTGTPFDFARTPDGTLWVATTHGLARMDNRGRWRAITSAALYPGGNPESMVMDGQGTLWVGDATHTWKLVSGGQAFVPAGAPVVMSRLYARLPPDSARMPEAPDGESLLDRSGALWTAIDKGLSRTVVGADGKSEVDAMARVDGLSNDDVQAFYQDREGDVWVATETGLDRFQATRFTPYPLPGHVEHPMIVAGNGADLYVASIWQAPFHITDPSHTIPMDGGNAGLTRDASGAAWFAGGPSLHRLKDGVVDAIALPPELGNPRRLPGVIAAYGTDDVWVSVRQNGLYRYHAGHWTRESGVHGMPTGEPLVMLVRGDHLWLGYAGGWLVDWTSSAGPKTVAIDTRLVGDITSLADGRDRLWIGGTNGVAWLGHGHAERLLGSGERRFESATGILVAQNKDLWISTSTGLFHILARDLPALVDQPGQPVPVEAFGPPDGFGELADAVESRPVLAQTGNGTIWVGSVGGLAFAEPASIPPLASLLPPFVQGITADGVDYPPEGANQLPPHPRNLRISYTSPYLSRPDLVQYRYRLRGNDEVWNLVGARHEALYTNLGKGTYVFDVEASLDGVRWTSARTAVSFVVLPAYYEAWWFRCIEAFVVLALFVLVQWGWRRVATVASDARIDERTRVARDIHDTLLQSVQAFIIHSHAAIKAPLAADDRQAMLERAIFQAEASLREGRDKVGQLRTPTLPSDLGDYLHLTAEELAGIHPASYRVDVAGQPLPLARSGFEQLQPICREAIINAFRHARPTFVHIVVAYRRTYLAVTVTDDGSGFDEAFLRRAPPGHWGLFGMRERAAALGASLRIRTSQGRGTRVEIRVRARRIFASG